MSSQTSWIFSGVLCIVIILCIVFAPIRWVNVIYVPIFRVHERLRDYFRSNSMISSTRDGLFYWLRMWLWTRSYYVSRDIGWTLDRIEWRLTRSEYISRRIRRSWDHTKRRVQWLWRYAFCAPYCMTCATTEHVTACFMNDNFTTIPDEYMCAEHATAAGYCYSCGKWDFDIVDGNRRAGLCENCQADIGDDWGPYDDEYDDLPWAYPYESGELLDEIDDWLDGGEGW